MSEFLCVVIGVVLGSITMVVLFFLHSTVGVLRIDRSNPEKDRYLFEIDNMASISKAKRVMLKVDNNADLSQK